MTRSPYLGLRFKDRISGFTGVGFSHVTYFTGCDQVGLHPGMMADGKIGEVQYFDVSRLIQIEGERIELSPPFEPARSNKGGPQDSPRGGV